ncbi:hypothetical protein Nepgr_004144 [Nepenthes gracilis]|uniref:Stachyose synthase n=1 Tax=Nepenthes gracilis TaxID=150966 RepID=A0AAD3S0S9_NEPGR|nr:hypothetical protein Nepgr_004144 [Nepenthes gracilis]
MPPPPDNPHAALSHTLTSFYWGRHFDLSDGKLSVKGVTLLSEIPSNITLTDFSDACESSDAPIPLYQRILSHSHKGGFLGFHAEEPSDLIINSLGKFTNRNFLSIFRFKTWWSTQWVGNSGFRSSLFPGDNGHVLIAAQSGSTQIKSSSFKAIAYVHVSQNPYKLMKEAYSAIRVHLNTFRLLEEKSTPSLMNKFGWCTWDALYLTVNPVGIWHGLNDFAQGGLALRFLIIDDGWQSVNFDDDHPRRDSRNLVLAGEQMTARLHRLDEGYKFRRYKRHSMLACCQSYNPTVPKTLISKAVEIKNAWKQRATAAGTGSAALDVCSNWQWHRQRRKAAETEEEMAGGEIGRGKVEDERPVTGLDVKIEKLQRELDVLLSKEVQQTATCMDECRAENSGMKAFTDDTRAEFKRLGDIYVWHALCGSWGGVRPETTGLKCKVMPCKVLHGLEGLMDDEGINRVLEGGIGLVDPAQAVEFYDSMHSYLKSAGITGVKVDVIHTLEYVCEEFGGKVELAKTYYDGLSKSLEKNFNGTNLISSMQQCNDFFFLGTKQISMGRAVLGDDFWYQDPYGDPDGVFWLQGVQMIHCAYNSLWMGQIIHPDWDMFQSDHLCAKFHAGSRSICGGPIYVSDCLGCHDFDLLSKLVYPDGTIPKCQHFALPTWDCLFKNPIFDQKTILKIWNFNKVYCCITLIWP